MKSKYLALFLLCAAIFPVSVRAQCSPFQGLGAAQFFGNDGTPLINGALYSFQAGGTTQQATFTDSTCTVANVNPITFTTGARVNIWLTTGNFYKFQLCLQNDGSTCAPSDVLFSVDQVPGGATGGGGGGPPFISGSPNPATSGVLRCASGDQCVVFRNVANSANLALTKDTNDVLSWAGGSIKFPAVGTPTGLGGGFSWLWNDNTANRWKVSNNGGSAVQLVVSGVDINTSDQVNQWHFGSTATPLSGTPPATNQVILWNGTNIVGTPLEQVFGWGSAQATIQNGFGVCSLSSTSGGYCAQVLLPSAHTIIRFTYVLVGAPSGCATSPVIGVRDVTSATNLFTVTITNGASTVFTDSGVLSVGTTAGDVLSVGLITSPSGCTGGFTVASLQMVYR